MPENTEELILIATDTGSLLLHFGLRKVAQKVSSKTAER